MARKRGQNMGSVYRRNDGRWVGQVTIESEKHYKYFKTQREAREWVQKTTIQVDDGLSFSATQITFKEFMHYWLDSAKPSIRPNTVRQYGYVVNNHIPDGLGKVKLKDLRPEMIQVLINKKLEEGLSTRTVELIFAVVRRALNQAVQQSILPRNPIKGVTKPKPKRPEMVTLTDTQVRTLLLAVRDTRFEALYQIAVTTGMRKGEILGLKWSDLDWVNRTLHVQRQLLRINNQGLVFDAPKSKASRRVIVLGEATIEKLRGHQTLQHKERLFAGERWQEYDLIFPSTIGTPMEPRNCVRHFKETLREANLPNVRFHDLRHSAASLMLQQGTHPKIVQERLGHASISLTLDTYSHVIPTMQEEVAAKIDELLTPIDVSVELASK